MSIALCRFFVKSIVFVMVDDDIPARFELNWKRVMLFTSYGIQFLFKKLLLSDILKVKEIFKPAIYIFINYPGSHFFTGFTYRNDN